MKQYAGHLYPKLKLTKTVNPLRNLRHIYVVVGSGNCDIGKGWLSASIATMVGNPLILKIDPMINIGFPRSTGIICDRQIVSDDFGTYKKLGLSINPEQNFVMGKIIEEFFKINKQAPLIGEKEIKKITYSDISYFLAQKVIGVINKHKFNNVIIEVGGVPNQQEHEIVQASLRFLGILIGVIPELVILTYFEYSEQIRPGKRFPLKSQIARQGIKEAMMKYSGLPLKAVFIRRRFVPQSVPRKMLREEILRIAYEVQIMPERIFFIDNVGSVEKMRVLVHKTNFKHV